MKMREVYAVYHDLATAYGHGPECCMDGLMSGKHALRKIDRFTVADGLPESAGLFPSDLPADESLFSLLAEKMPSLSADVPLYAALSVGNIQALENQEGRWTSDISMDRLLQISGLKRGRLYSAACAAGNLVIGRAYSAIAHGLEDVILTAGFDFVSEFVYSGFYSCHAMSPDNQCRPFDAAHNGLLLGDAAGLVLLASAEAVEKYHWTPVCRIGGYGTFVDTFHIAAPDPSGNGMAAAIRTALNGRNPLETGAVIGHGTGTVLNDEMEVLAVRQVFPEGTPLVSLKGGTGHLLSASGFAGLSCAVEMIKRKKVFPQTGLTVPEPGAENYVSDQIRDLRYDRIVTMNAGFGGLNAVLLIEGGNCL